MTLASPRARENETYLMHMPSRRELITEQMELREREESIPHETQREREHIAEHKAREHTEGRTHGQGHDTSPQQRRCAARIENRNAREGRTEKKEHNKKSTHGPENEEWQQKGRIRVFTRVIDS